MPKTMTTASDEKATPDGGYFSASDYAAPWRFKSIPFDELVERFSPHSGILSMALKTIDNIAMRCASGWLHPRRIP